MQKKTVRKYRRADSSSRSVTEVLDELTLDEMFNKFMTFKKTEGLAPRTIDEYYKHFDNIKEFLEENKKKKNITEKSVNLNLWLRISSFSNLKIPKHSLFVHMSMNCRIGRRVCEVFHLN
ncbi:hypothetical protein ABES02_16095 [Neobacillus pocheonensis]|uniref:hypothetical protein n=1 Tax=Neobacillus pocheonensis TaxID=363869 RepID=UPI003D266A5D